jgi:hypothetical protein
MGTRICGERKEIMKRLLIALLLFAVTGTCFAQEAPKYRPTGVYNLKFVISEVENGKATNQRTYMMIIREETNGEIKTGNRVPIATGSTSSAAQSSTNTQFQYIDVGFNADAFLSEREGNLAVDMNVDISGVVSPDSNSSTPSLLPPLIRQLRQRLHTVLANGKPTIVTSVDDVNTKKTVQVEVTATKLK